MKSRTEIINGLIKENEYTSYLEIGLGDGTHFKNVKCENKIGVEPEKSIKLSNVFNVTSDKFFEQSSEKYDIIFIDGLHHADQVERDIVNSYACLNKGGVILIHDCNPWEEKMTRVPRETNSWTGDVWKAVFGWVDEYGEKIKHEFIQERAGIFAIWKTGRFKVSDGFNKPELDWDYFQENKGMYYGI